jgi:hypothetical protein
MVRPFFMQAQRWCAGLVEASRGAGIPIRRSVPCSRTDKHCIGVEEYCFVSIWGLYLQANLVSTVMLVCYVGLVITLPYLFVCLFLSGYLR